MINFVGMRETLSKLRAALRPVYGSRETEAIIRIIFHHLKGWNTVDMLIHEPEPLSPFVRGEIETILKRLLRHEPIQYITGEARFHGLELTVTPDVLIPRPETAELVDLIADSAGDREDLRVLDIATGSGCIAVALALTLRFPVVTAVDISSPAIKVAETNARRYKASVKFVTADIFRWAPPSESLDIIVSNPPYIGISEKNDMEPNVTDYEPASALFVPDDNPLLFYSRIVDVAADALVNGGSLWFEINPLHADGVADLMRRKDFTDVSVILDSFGKRRFCRGVKS